MSHPSEIVLSWTMLIQGVLELNEISRKILHYCAECDIEWLQSYMSLARTKVIYELNAPDIRRFRKRSTN